MAAEKLTVDRNALIQLLNAINGHGHEIRELQVTRGLHSMGGDYTNPIETLLAEVREQVKPKEPVQAADWSDKQLWDLYSVVRRWAEENRVNGENRHGRAESHALLVAHLATLGAKP